MVDPDLRILAGGPPPSADEVCRLMPVINMIPDGSSNILVHRSVLNRAGRFDTNLRHLADWDMWIRLAQLDLPAVVAEPIVAYVLHSHNASVDTGKAPDEILVIEQRYRHLRDQPRLDAAWVHRWIASHHLRSGQRVKALKAYARAVRAGHTRSIATALLGAVWPEAVWRGRPWQRDHLWMESATWLGELALTRRT